MTTFLYNILLTAGGDRMMETDPHGWTLTLISVTVVFSALIVLYFVYSLSGSIFSASLSSGSSFSSLLISRSISPGFLFSGLLVSGSISPGFLFSGFLVPGLLISGFLVFPIL